MLNVQLCNSRSACNKFSEISDHLSSYNIDLFFVTESWLNNSVTDGMVCPSGYNILRCDRCVSRGGGVFILYKSHLQVCLVELPKRLFTSAIQVFEFICIDLHIASVKY